jgi:glycosyltransferase involved in cell wall biosynthesis
MDGNVLPLHVHSLLASPDWSLAFEKGKRIVPTLTLGSPVVRSEAVSLIIPTFFNRRLKNCALCRLLDGVERSRVVNQIVLVVASGTDDEEESFARVSGGKACVVVHCEPNRRAQSRNVGVSKASNDVLLFLDDDMVLKDWTLIDVLVSELLTGGFDCALFPRRQYAKFPLLYNTEALDWLIARWRTEEGDVDDPSLLDPVRHGAPYVTMAFCFPGCFMLIRREAYDRIGGFPADYEGWGFEDAVFALRAVTTLRVLNLFWKSSPLLHIDHPVSPYKSAEYAANMQRFHSSHGTLDMDWLCREIFKGEDFAAAGGRTRDVSACFEPLKSVADAYHLPCVNDGLAKYYSKVMRERVEDGHDPIPEQIVLHGSRGGGTSTSESDFDLLFLYRVGAWQDFFVCESDGFPRVEAEFSHFGKFEQIASRPVSHPLNGPFELAKVAQGIVLWGDADAWRVWADRILEAALRLGRVYWLVYALGMGLRPEKVGILRDRFATALRTLMVRVDAGVYREDIRRLDEFRLDDLGAHIGSALDRERPGWRDAIRGGNTVFSFQVPEVWIALRWILNGS